MPLMAGWLGCPGCGANLDGCSDWGQPVTRRSKPVEIQHSGTRLYVGLGTGQNA